MLKVTQCFSVLFNFPPKSLSVKETECFSLATLLSLVKTTSVLKNST